MTDTKGKTVYFKNPAREVPDRIPGPYRPQYEEMGVEPVDYPPQHQTVKIQAAKNQPNQNFVFGQSRRGVAAPNVGNVDSFDETREVIVDDLSHLDPNQPMIDNNDHYTVAALQRPFPDVDWERMSPRFSRPPQQEVRHQTFQSSEEDYEQSLKMVQDGTLEVQGRNIQVSAPKISVRSDAVQDLNPLSLINELEADTFLLFVSGSPICSAPLKQIEEEVNALLFGQHELCKTQTITENDILVVRKVPIKIGVFLEG